MGSVKNRLGNYSLFLIIIVFGFAACGPNYVYESTLECPQEGWAFQDSLKATFEVADSNTIYNLHLVLDHSTEFSYQNFYTRVHTTFPNGERISEQLSLELAGKGGVWLGNCDQEECELDILIQKGVFFNQIGTYQVVIEQFSRQDPLKGIQNVVFALEETGEKR